MNDDFGAAHDMGSRELRIQNFLRCNHGQIADFSSRDRKHAIQSVNIEVLVPNVMGCRLEARRQASVTKNHISGWPNDEADLEIKLREIRINFVNIAGQVYAIVLCDLAQRLILDP